MTLDEQSIAKASNIKHGQNTKNNSPTPSREIVSAEWAGPLPPPSVLQAFDEVVENGAERIVRMAEKEQQHRINCESAELEASVKDFRRGQWLGAALTAACIAGTVYSVYIGVHPSVSIALVGIPIMAIIGKLIKAN